jgi:hypothetical protein
MLNCHRCGLTNKPYDAACVICGDPLQEQAAADAKRKEWDALGPKMRAEQEAVFDRMLGSRREHLEWLNNHRLVHAAAGALILNFVMLCGTLFQAPWCIFFDLALGAAAGLLLNRLRGGSWQGAGIFFVAGGLSILLKLPFIGSELGGGYWLLAVFGLLFLLCIGYVMGLKLHSDHSDRSVTT